MKNKPGSFFKWGNKDFLALLIGIVSFGIYANTISNFYNLDDELITENHVLTDNSFLTFKKIFTEPYYKDQAGNKYEYRPVVLAVYFLEFLFFGRNPHVSHFFNVVLYAATCIILFYLLLLLFKDFSPVAGAEASSSKKQLDKGDGWLMGMPPFVVVSFSIAMLFAVHSLHTEVVASIKNRDEILSLLFVLMSWFFALKFVESKKIVLFLLYVLFFILGLFSKQTSISFAILIPVSIIMFRQVSFQMLFSLMLPIQLISVIFAPIFLIYKKVGLFVAQLLFLIFFYYFISKREVLVDIAFKLYKSIIAITLAIGSATRRYINSFTFSISNGFIQFKAKSNVLLKTVFTLIVLIGGIYGIRYLMTQKAEVLEKAKWEVQDKIHDFNELQVVPATQVPAPAIIPIAGRRLNYVEIPLLYEKNREVKLATSVYVLGKYLRLMLIPYPLTFYYGYAQVPLITFSNTFTIVWLINYVVIISLMLYLLFVRKHSIAAFGLLFLIVAIIPLSNILTPIAGIMAERLSYSSTLGFCIVFGFALIYPYIFSSQSFLGIKSSLFPRISFVVYGLFLFSYAGMTISRNFLWKDHITLMSHDIKYMEGSARGHHLYASHLAVKASELKQTRQAESVNMLKKSVVHFKRTLEIYPDFPNVWYDLAKVYMLLGEDKNAIQAYTTSTQKDTMNASPCFELAIVLEKAGRVTEAENFYKLAIKRNALFKEAYINLSYLYYRQERYQESIEVNLAAIKNLPEAYEIYVNLGRTYLMLKDTPSALSYLEKAVAINRSDKSILNLMAELYAQMGNMDKANYYRSLR